MRPGFGFEIAADDGAARAGRLTTPHGVVETPAFMPVATYGAVRGVAPADLSALGAQMLLANTYHLHERPGEDVVAGTGGLHGFTGWRGPWLTDSGGFQITSLADRVTLDEEGVTFASPLDGQRRRLTPESAMAVQEALGADVAMALDECQPVRGRAAHAALAPDRPGASRGESALAAAVDRTLRWAERCVRSHRRPDQALFGIVQGGASEPLRRASARATAGLGFDGFAHGGLGLGEEASARGDLLGAVHAELPPASPRYLMGFGQPADLVRAVECGVDLFDCVIPTRHARHGVLFTSQGRLSIRNAAHKGDTSPPDRACACPACRDHGRAYLRHLFLVNEMLGARLATLHNLRFYLDLMARARAAIAAGRFRAFRDEVLAVWDPH
jgi:queuine tRNA-ribosyltransferase